MLAGVPISAIGKAFECHRGKVLVFGDLTVHSSRLVPISCSMYFPARSPVDEIGLKGSFDDPPVPGVS